MFLLLLNSLFIFLSLQFAHSSPETTSSFDFDDKESLISFKNSITYDPQGVLQDWNSDLTFCNWTGVTCNLQKERVIQLNLSGMGLHGLISPHLANLSFLEGIYFSNNTFYGHIPLQLGRLARLRELWLEGNQLDGTVPSTLCNCQNLVNLSLSNNYLTGLIPPELGLLTELRMLYIDGNEMRGAIPPCLSNISTLTELGLHTNNLNGAIPPQFGRLTRLEYLGLGENQLTGEIPPSLSNCTHLRALELFHNQLTGHIPWELGAKLLNLEQLLLWQNQLSGNIPNSLANCSKLRLLDLQYNRLTGAIPADLGKLLFLQRLRLNANQLVSGITRTLPFVTALTNCSHLQILNLAFNFLKGVLPDSIGQLSTKLSILDLESNFIEGEIPQQIANLTNLTMLGLSFNRFTGRVPSALGRLQNVERLYMRFNKLQGNIPTEFGGLKRLGLLALGGNMISGQIPDIFSNLGELRALYLHQNHLSGNIPASLGQCWRLEHLDLSGNSLSGNITAEVAGLQNLLFFDLSRNMLEGSLPPEVSKMQHVLAINVSANHLSGHIPVTIGSCVELQYLNLSGNNFEGSIPNLLGQLKSLEDIDLSSNHLSGTIPKSLEKLSMLRHLNFSFNYLTGEIPRSGIFTNITSASLMGNPGLCGTWLNMPPCPTPIPLKHRHRALFRKIMISMLGIITVFILCCLLVARFFCKRYRQKRNEYGKNAFALNKMGYPVISQQELFKATNGFSEANLLGVGSFGAVYKGILSDETIVAVKVLNLQNEQAHKSFTMECKALGRVRHRNLVKIITSCSNLHFKGLVLQFMPNGSLEKLLYAHDGEESNMDVDCELKLGQRLSIALDIAHAMEYLHHDCPFRVVHCDLKPSNVLLDENMTAHVTDFGIAQLTCADSMDSYTSTIQLKGSIGYIAPEYGVSGRVSTKGDVYSYGILLLELLTGKRPTSNMFVGELNLHRWVSMPFPDRIVEVVDRCLLPDDDGRRANVAVNEQYECLVQLMAVGLACTKDSAEDRPNMREVVVVLENVEEMFAGSERTSRFRGMLTPTISALLDLDRTTSFRNDGGGVASQSCSSTL